MARLEATAKAGYYPLPDDLVPLIARAFELTREQEGYSYTGCFAILDPCAGKGEAIYPLQEALAYSYHRLEERWVQDPTTRVGKYEKRVSETKTLEYPKVFACELELSRYKALMTAHTRRHASSVITQGDSFTIDLSTGPRRLGVNMLYLNPPYDHDGVRGGRIEWRWLERFSKALAFGGVLAFVVPFYVLKDSADLLGRLYEEVQICRFPPEHFGAYKQVVLFARRGHDLSIADEAIVEQVTRAAEGTGDLLDLSAVKPYAVAPLGRPNMHHGNEGDAGFAHAFEAHVVDVSTALAAFKPWHTTVKKRGLQPIPRVTVSGLWRDLCLRTFPMACIPRPAYIAAGIASGVFNGSRIEPDDPTRYPPIYVKGTFAKVYHTVNKDYGDDGSVTSEVRVQHPRLEITVLDGSTYKYVDLKSAVHVTPTAVPLSEFTVGDLFAHYSRGMMGALRERCPVLHDSALPEHNFPLPAFPRRLFAAQESAVRAACKLLDQPDRAALVLGQIGSGKSTVALATAHTRGARAVLIVAPPHLLKSWSDQCSYVVPWATVYTLDGPAALRAFDEDTTSTMKVGVMSREAAKLGHAYEGLENPMAEVFKRGKISRAQLEGFYRCPSCGAKITDTPEACATKRLRCKGRRFRLLNEAARLGRRLAWVIAARLPRNKLAGEFIVAPAFNAARERSEVCENRSIALDRGELRRIGEALIVEIERIAHEHVDNEETLETGLPSSAGGLGKALIMLSLYLQEPVFTWKAHEAMKALRLRYGSRIRNNIPYPTRQALEDLADHILVTLPPSQLVEGIERALASRERDYSSSTYALKSIKAHLEKGERFDPSLGLDAVTREDKKLELRCFSVRHGSTEALEVVLRELAGVSVIDRESVCGAALYKGVPRPRRYPLARLIARRHRRTFDFLVIDEGHEYSNQDSAQSQAAQVLYGLKLPTLVLTGSIMNGYASSLFLPCWYLSSKFRGQFGRDDLPRFVETYGYLKKTVTQRKAPVQYGKVSDRQDPKESFSQAPGVMALALLQFLLPIAVTLQLEDLEVELPALSEIVEEVEATGEQAARYREAVDTLVKRIKKDRKDPVLRGKLFGQMAEVPSLLDRCTADTGTDDRGHFVVKYPESVGGEVLCDFPGLPASTLLPKERRLLSILDSEAKEGRNSMVFVWHVDLMPRLKRLIEAAGHTCVILDASKVPAKKREAWIDKEVVKKKARVLLVNPVAVSTGLNNLVWFSTGIWYEGPACNPIVRRQAQGRLYRIGQLLAVRIYTLHYGGTAQELLHRLLLLKVGVSEAADGLDPELALQAAGVGNVDLTAGRQVGELLYQMIIEARGGTVT